VKGPERDEKRKDHSCRDKALKDEAIAAGGLYILATETSMKAGAFDNQLRAARVVRAIRADPSFFLSACRRILMRIFAPSAMDSNAQRRLALKDGEPDQSIRGSTRASSGPQKEGLKTRDFDIRKKLPQI